MYVYVYIYTYIYTDIYIYGYIYIYILYTYTCIRSIFCYLVVTCFPRCQTNTTVATAAFIRQDQGTGGGAAAKAAAVNWLPEGTKSPWWASRVKSMA